MAHELWPWHAVVCVCVLQALEGTLTVEVRPSNAVTSVSIDSASIPMDPVPAGSSLPVVVKLETEDQQPLTLEDAQKGLTLSLIAPGANSKAAQVCCPYFCCTQCSTQCFSGRCSGTNCAS